MDPQALAALNRRLDRLERANRLWRRLALAGFALAALLVAVSLDRPRPLTAQEARPPVVKPAEAQPDHVKLARERLQLSRKAFHIMDELAARGNPVVNPRQEYFLWSYRMLGDQIYLSLDDADPRVADPEVYLAVSHPKTNPARLAAFADHLKRMTWWEDVSSRLTRTGTMSVLTFLEVQARRVEAELWLARERLKTQRLKGPDARLKSSPANEPFEPLTPDTDPGPKE